MKAWDKEQLDKAFELRRKGCTYKQIGERFGLSTSATYGRMNRRSYRVAPVPRYFAEYELEKMIQMRYRGQSIREIAEYFGCDPKTISDELHMHGVIRRDYLQTDVRFEIKRMREEGVPFSQIAGTLDLTSAEVRYAVDWMKRHGEMEKLHVGKAVQHEG